MSALNPISRNNLIKKLKRIGFTGPYSGTRHQYLEKENHLIFIPNPHGKDIGIPLLKQIIKQIGINKNDFIKL